MRVPEGKQRTRALWGFCVVVAFTIIPAAYSDQQECKAELRALLTRYQMAPEDELRHIRELGDILEAAREIVEEEATVGLQNDPVARIALLIIADSNDPRARAILLPYLELPERSDKRRMVAITFVLKTADAPGEEWIQRQIEASPDREERAHLVAHIGNWGGPHWLPYLRAMTVGERDREAGVDYWRRRAIDELERRRAQNKDTPAQHRAANEPTPHSDPPRNNAQEPTEVKPSRQTRGDDSQDPPRHTSPVAMVAAFAAIGIAIAIVLRRVLRRSHPPSDSRA